MQPARTSCIIVPKARGPSQDCCQKVKISKGESNHKHIRQQEVRWHTAHENHGKNKHGLMFMQRHTIEEVNADNDEEQDIKPITKYIYAKLGRPAPAHLFAALSNSVIPNCPVTIKGLKGHVFMQQDKICNIPKSWVLLES